MLELHDLHSWYNAVASGFAVIGLVSVIFWGFMCYLWSFVDDKEKGYVKEQMIDVDFLIGALVIDLVIWAVVSGLTMLMVIAPVFTLASIIAIGSLFGTRFVRRLNKSLAEHIKDKNIHVQEES